MTAEMQPKTSNQAPSSNCNLKNGLSFKIIEDNSYPFVYSLILYGAGSCQDPPYKKGLAHFLEHLYFRIYLKNKTLDEYTFLKYGTNNAFTTPDYTIFYFRFPSKFPYEGLFLEREKLKNFTLNDRDFFIERNVVLEEIKMYQDNPFEIIRNEFLHHFLMDDHPYKFPVIGYKSDILNIREIDIFDFFRNFYIPENMTIVVGGKIKKNRISKKIEEYFSDFKNKKRKKREFLPPVRHKAGYFEMKGKFKNTHILIGFLCPYFKSDEFDVFSLFPHLFTEGKTSLFHKLIENGLISSASTIIEENKIENFLFFHFVLPEKKNLNRVLKKIEKILDKVKVEEDAFRGLKKRAITEYIYEQEDLFNRCLRNTLCTYYKKEDNFIKNIKTLNSENFHKIIKKRIDLQKMAVGVLIGRD